MKFIEIRNLNPIINLPLILAQPTQAAVMARSPSQATFFPPLAQQARAPMVHSHEYTLFSSLRLSARSPSLYLAADMWAPPISFIPSLTLPESGLGMATGQVQVG
jgi:hypothetical protein